MNEFTTIAYGIRETPRGASVVQVVARPETVRIGDYVGTRRVILHRGIGHYGNVLRAELKAQRLAAESGVPYVGDKADRL